MNNIDIQHILFLDIETVSGVAKFEELSEEMQYLWADKTKWQRKEEFTPEDYYSERAGKAHDGVEEAIAGGRAR